MVKDGPNTLARNATIAMIMLLGVGASATPVDDSVALLGGIVSQISSTECAGYSYLDSIDQGFDDVDLYGNPEGWCILWDLDDHTKPGADVSSYAVWVYLYNDEDEPIYVGSGNGGCTSSEDTENCDAGAIQAREGSLTGPWPDGVSDFVTFGLYGWTIDTTLVTQAPVTQTYEVKKNDCNPFNGDPPSTDQNSLALAGLVVGAVSLVVGGAALVYDYCTATETETNVEIPEDLAVTTITYFDVPEKTTRVSAVVDVDFGGGTYYGEDTWNEYEDFIGTPYDSANHAIEFEAERVADGTIASYSTGIQRIHDFRIISSSNTIVQMLGNTNYNFKIEDNTNGQAAHINADVTIDFEAPEEGTIYCDVWHMIFPPPPHTCAQPPLGPPLDYTFVDEARLHSVGSSYFVGSDAADGDTIPFTVDWVAIP